MDDVTRLCMMARATPHSQLPAAAAAATAAARGAEDAGAQPDPCLPPFPPAGAELRMQGLNRIGNMLVPNSNYVKFEEWIM